MSDRGWLAMTITVFGLVLSAVAGAASGRLDRQRRTVEATVAALNAHDARRLAALYAPDAVVASVGESGWQETRGRAALEADHRALFQRLPDVRFAMTRLFLGDGVAVLEWATTGTGTDGQRAFQAATVYTFDRAGRIATDHTFFDVVRPLPKELATRAPTIVTATANVVAPSLHEVGELAREARRSWTFGAPGTTTAFVVAELVVAARTAEGKQSTLHILDIAELRDGRVVRVTTYGNRREAQSPTP